jgi:hypothetical protein
VKWTVASTDPVRGKTLRAPPRSRRAWSAALLVAGIALPALVSGQDEQAPEDGGPFFYRGLTYGSESIVGPLDVLLNKGFDLAQVGNRERQIFDYPYATRHVTDALLHPGKAIDRIGGWGYFLRTQVLPLTFSTQYSKWAPNYFGHAITGGIVSRRLGEWFQAHGWPRPMLMGAAVTLAAAVLNEAYEHPGATRGSAGTVADLYIFDLGGVLLFSRDGIASFFSRRLNTTVWQSQASIAVPSGELVNNGNHMILKVPWGVIENTSLFFRTGLSGQLGLTLHRRGGLDVSAALGFEAGTMHIDDATGEETVDFVLTGGVFVDRDGSLLASAVASAVADRLLTLNVYPGVLGIAGGSLGFWMVLPRSLKPRIGLSSRMTLGAGLGLGLGW